MITMAEKLRRDLDVLDGCARQGDAVALAPAMPCAAKKNYKQTQRLFKKYGYHYGCILKNDNGWCTVEGLCGDGSLYGVVDFVPLPLITKRKKEWEEWNAK